MGSGAGIGASTRVGARALAVSSALVITVAGVFDVLAGHRPHHTLSLLLLAGTVGVARRLLRGRLRGFFTLVNLAVLGPPVERGLHHLTASTAHSPVVPEHLVALSAQIVVALLVVVVAGSEPIMVFAASRVLAAAPSCTAPWAAATPRSAAPAEVDVAATRRDVVVRCRPRRGPPVVLATVG